MQRVKIEYIKASEAAELWGISLHRVQELCKKGRIPGVTRFGKSWMIPIDAQKPPDARYKKAEEGFESTPTLPMPRKSPFLNMTNLYTESGSAAEVMQSLANNPEACALFTAEIAYSRGEIDKVIEHARYFLDAHSGFYAVNAGGMLLALAAIWKGDIHLYREAKVHICEAPWKTVEDKQIMALSLACIDSAVRDISIEGYPEWFRQGQFEHLHPDSHPAAKVFYIKYFIIAAQEHAKGAFSLPDVSGMGLMRVIPYIAEPLISRVVAEKLVIPEIYLRLLTAISYHQLGNNAAAIPHIDKAIDLALPDGLLGLLAEHKRNLDNLLDDRLLLKNEAAYAKYKELHKGFLEGWTKLHNSLLSRSVTNALTVRQREMCRLAAFGLSDNEIADRMHVSVSHVKKELYIAKNKTGAMKRRELGAYV